MNNMEKWKANFEEYISEDLTFIMDCYNEIDDWIEDTYGDNPDKKIICSENFYKDGDTLVIFDLKLEKYDDYERLNDLCWYRYKILNPEHLGYPDKELYLSIEYSYSSWDSGEYIDTQIVEKALVTTPVYEFKVI